MVGKSLSDELRDFTNAIEKEMGEEQKDEDEELRKITEECWAAINEMKG